MRRRVWIEVVQMIQQCPRCELKFRSEAEFKSHAALDHGLTLEEAFSYRSPSRSVPPIYDEPEAPSPVPRVLVVANETLAAPHLAERLHARAAEGPASFHLVVPASPEGGETQARWRLEHALERFRAAGLQIDGEVGPADPLEAVAQTLEERRADEIILSTLRPGLSRWLGMDLERRIERRWRIPVQTVSAEG